MLACCATSSRGAELAEINAERHNALVQHAGADVDPDGFVTP
jgi:hypothetical protein